MNRHNLPPTLQQHAWRAALFLLALLLTACASPASSGTPPLPNTPSPPTQSPIPNYPITQLPNYPITQLPNYPITQLPNYPITQLPPTQPPATPTPQPTNPPTEQPTSQPPTLLPLAIPIPADGVRTVDPSYRFATTQGGAREPHHGVEFLNPFGSPALAAADGVVLFAGNDNNGGPYSPPGWYAFYGNFVVIQHTGAPQPPAGQAPNANPQPQLYTLYAHLSELSVQTGERVTAGQEIGRIGFSGAAEGPHLHLEVRLGGTAYADSRNPELWLQPEEGHGALAGRILNANGYPIPSMPLTITPLDPPGYPIYLITYEEPAVANQPPYYENFALGNLPAGTYQITYVLDGLQERTFQIQPGQITQLEIKAGDEN